jgi:hypothetical protein
METITKNNSASMKTVVETYIIEETQELIYDNEKLDQWNMRVSELGLTGQTKIQAKDKSPIPFLHMKSTLVSVFAQLCPRMVDIKDYDKTPIPVEILDLAALSVREKYFNKIEIWYDDKTPDPACIGSTGRWVVYKKNYSHLGEFATEAEALALKDDPEYYNHYFQETAKYLIGRWADVKQSLEELAAKAKKLFVASQKSEIEKSIREEKRKLEDLEHSADVRFGFDDAIGAPTGLPF